MKNKLILKPSPHLKKGFTLIELLIYMTISFSILVVAVNLAWDLITSEKKARIQQDIDANARLVMNQLQQSIRGADNVNLGASSSFNVNPGVLSLKYPGSGNDIVFDTYSRNVVLPSGTISVTTLRKKVGAAAAVDLTTNKVIVSNFIVRNLTRSTEQKNIRIELTLQSINAASDIDYNQSVTLETSLALRKNI
jgi:type II secretory pathway pseudopilin PulG